MKLLCYIDDDLNETQGVNEGEENPDEELIAADLSHLHALDGQGSSSLLLNKEQRDQLT